MDATNKDKARRAGIRVGYTDEQILDALREADAVGVSAGTIYGNRAAQENWPSIRCVILRFGSWNDARMLAGLPVNREAHASGKRWAIAPSDCLAALIECAEALGHVPVYSEYVEWQESHPERNVQTGAVVTGKVPSGPTVRAKLLTWNRAKFLAAFVLGWEVPRVAGKWTVD